MKVAVYTISLNEAAHAERWASSAADADYRIVADTGSTDDTVEQLTNAGVTVHRIAIHPWRFDDARNAAMALIPADVDVCLTMDMDEFLAPGWRPALERAWAPDTTALYCRKVARSSADDPSPLKSFPVKNFHQRWGYRFRRPVHEHLVFTGTNELTRDCADIIIHHLQDHTKTTRNRYLPLMEVAQKEDPEDAQICFWLGRDYMWANQHERSIELLQRYLMLPSSTWTDERSEAMRYLARMQPDKKMQWLDKARIEAPRRREIWLELAEELHGRAEWANLFWACVNGIETTQSTGSYLDDAHCWGSRLFDLGAIAAWHLNVMDRAVEWGRKACELDPSNQRLQNNLNFFIQLRDGTRTDAGLAHPKQENRPDGMISQNVIDGQSISFFVTNPHDAIMKYHYAGSFYEAEELDLIKRYYTEGSTFVDVGANVGNHSIYVSRFLKAKKILPFEPNQVAISVLKENLLLNQCDNVDTRFLGIALAGRKTRLKQTTPDANNLGHTCYYEEAFGDVAAIDGDSLIVDEAVGFIKIDVEGMELEILSGLEQTIRRWQPTIFVEVWDNKFQPFVDWCERASYQIVEQYRRYEGIQNYVIQPTSSQIRE
ncbi:FkbM family methyltransferase [Bradyrhizobium septentrionale]|uniref:FkbM family methyltransferase n=1 Tax=Bradyrhizobium septentrionale TaxID=1404411 RepID=UPI001596ED70|nr:FkbM family methyltransferase [Bradyrhizobium septentrionale]UGY22000.1 FkbM family methyltransferase [Bradyrhizobium septentrionale]